MTNSRLWPTTGWRGIAALSLVPAKARHWVPPAEHEENAGCARAGVRASAIVAVARRA
jgi:hypothetical protein